MEGKQLSQALRRDLAAIGLLTLALAALRAWIVEATGLELHFDEAQYWTWSQQLDWSYYSKGPLIAWIMAASEALLGHGEIALRLPAWLAHGAIMALLYRFTWDVWKDRAAARWAAVIFLFTPMYFVLGTVMTTDVWLFLFWTWGLWAGYRALIFEQRRAWIEAGIALGFGILTKASIGLLPLLAGIAMLGRPAWRAHLRYRELWIGLGVFALFSLPVLGWNAANDWVMLRHEQGHVAHSSWSPLNTLVWFAGQFMALSPLIALLGVAHLWRRPRQPGPQLLWWLSLGWLSFFLVKSGGGDTQVNWAAPIYLGLLILLAGHAVRFGRFRRGVMIAGMASAVLFVAIGFYPYPLGIEASKEPLKKMRGWGEAVETIRQASPETDAVLAPNYRLASQLQYYWGGPVKAYVDPGSTRRLSQHNLWGSMDERVGKDILWVSESSRPSADITAAFKRCRPLGEATLRAVNGEAVTTLYFAWCENQQPYDWPTPDHY